MALLVDKHRPRSLETLTYHHDLSDRLRSLVSSFAPSDGKVVLTPS
jgi:replication factor C subunit 3/5